MFGCGSQNLQADYSAPRGERTPPNGEPRNAGNRDGDGAGPSPVRVSRRTRGVTTATRDPSRARSRRSNSFLAARVASINSAFSLRNRADSRSARANSSSNPLASDRSSSTTARNRLASLVDPALFVASSARSSSRFASRVHADRPSSASASSVAHLARASRSARSSAVVRRRRYRASRASSSSRRASRASSSSSSSSSSRAALDQAPRASSHRVERVVDRARATGRRRRERLQRRVRVDDVARASLERRRAHDARARDADASRTASRTTPPLGAAFRRARATRRGHGDDGARRAVGEDDGAARVEDARGGGAERGGGARARWIGARARRRERADRRAARRVERRARAPAAETAETERARGTTGGGADVRRVRSLRRRRRARGRIREGLLERGEERREDRASQLRAERGG